MRGGGPQPVAQSRHARGLSGPSDFRAPRGARLKPEGLPQDSADFSVPATTKTPRSGFRENRHTVGVAGPGARRIRLAQGGNCEGPLIRRRRTFTASGTTVGGMNPGQATEPGSSSKTTGLAPPLNTGARLAGSLDPARPATRPNSPTRQDASTRPQQLAQGSRTRHNQGFPNKPTPPVASTATQPRVSSRPIQAVRWDESSFRDEQGNSAPPMPLVSRNAATVPLTYPLTRAGVATVPPHSPLTTASGNLTESTVHDSTRPRPDDRQDGAQSP